MTTMRRAHETDALEELDAAPAEYVEAVAAARAAGERRRRAIEAATAAGLSRRAIARRLDVTSGRIQQILTGR